MPRVYIDFYHIVFYIIFIMSNTVLLSNECNKYYSSLQEILILINNIDLGQFLKILKNI